jgi:hypothetical protein
MSTGLSGAINATQVAEVIRVIERDNQIHVVHRVHRGKLGHWLSIVEGLLARKSPQWSLNVTKQYFLNNGRLAYAWNFIVISNDMLSEAVAEAEGWIRKLTPSIQYLGGGALEGYPLNVKNPDRNKPGVSRHNPQAPGMTRGGGKHKGAYTI